MTTLSTLGDKPAIRTPAELIERVRSHDYTAAMSDDGRYWRAAERDWAEITQAAKDMGMEPVLRWSSLLRGATFWGPTVLEVLEAALADKPDDFKRQYAVDNFRQFYESEHRP